MQTLELECPSCGEHLELDSGFAGGVCRCSSCGTLMTVPSEAGRAEQLSTLETGGEGSAVSPDDLRPITPGRSTGARGGRGKQRKGRGGVRGGAVQAGAYRTATGRVVQIEGASRVPLARGKKRQVRVATTVVFVGVLLLVVVVAAVAIATMAGRSDPGTTAAGEPSAGGAPDTAAPTPTYDAQANPYTVDYPNVVGLPITGRVSIVIEASRNSGYWMPQASDTIRAGLRRRGLPASVALFAATANEPEPFADGRHKPLAQLNASLLASWFGALPADREVDRLAAIEAALNAKPDTLVLILSDADADEVQQWEALVDQHDGLTVHAVLVDGLSRPLRSWLRQRDGSEFISLQSDAFTAWRSEAEKRTTD